MDSCPGQHAQEQQDEPPSKRLACDDEEGAAEDEEGAASSNSSDVSDFRGGAANDGTPAGDAGAPVYAHKQRAVVRHIAEQQVQDGWTPMPQRGWQRRACEKVPKVSRGAGLGIRDPERDCAAAHVIAAATPACGCRSTVSEVPEMVKAMAKFEAARLAAEEARDAAADLDCLDEDDEAEVTTLCYTNLAQRRDAVRWLHQPARAWVTGRFKCASYDVVLLFILEHMLEINNHTCL